MLLAEPPPSQGDVHFRLLGFPVRIHPFFWVMTYCISGFMRDPIQIALWFLAVLPCILLHELSHAVVMRSYGMNVSIVLHAFGGLAIPRGRRIGSREPGPWGQILISAAGPASGFILTGVLVLVLHYVMKFPMEMQPAFRKIVPAIFITGHDNLTNYLFFVFQISILWGLMNLLPVLPLDGGQIFYQIFTLVHPADATRNALLLSVIVAGIMCFVAITQWNNDLFIAVLFFWLGFTNFNALQSVRNW